MRAFTTSLMLFLLAAPIRADLDLDRRLARSATTWQKTSPENLNSPENKMVLEEMKRRLQITPDKQFAQSEYLGPLLKAGDDETLRRLAALEERYRDISLLKRSQQPKLIALIADDLNRDEDLKPILSDDLVTFPNSVRAATIIRAIILSCPLFTQDLRNWAETLPSRPMSMQKHPEQMATLRRWWAENRELLQTEKFALVKRPSAVAR